MLIVVVIYISRLMRTEKLELSWSIGTGFRIGLRYAKLKSIENQVRPPVFQEYKWFLHEPCERTEGGEIHVTAEFAVG